MIVFHCEIKLYADVAIQVRRKKMRNFLFASHAYMADGAKSSLELILGKQEYLDTLCAYVEDPYIIEDEIQKRIDALDMEDELIVVTDLFGGSVNNAFMTTISKDERVYLVAGLNLALCISLLVRKDDECSTPQLIRECLEEAKKSLFYCNDLITSNSEANDEEF